MISQRTSVQVLQGASIPSWDRQLVGMPCVQCCVASLSDHSVGTPYIHSPNRHTDMVADAGAQVLPPCSRAWGMHPCRTLAGAPPPVTLLSPPPNCHTYMVAADAGAQVLPHVLRGGVVRILSCAWASIAIGIKGVVLRLV